MPKFSPGKFTACVAVTGLAILASVASPVQAQKVYYGCADQWNDLLKNPDDWTFVRHNADGFYINFVELEPKFSNKTQDLLDSTADLFTNKNAYFESDMSNDGQSLAFDQRDIDNLQKAGFRVLYTSLNYGWSMQRYVNLKQYHLLEGQSQRYSFVQQGPWGINGSILLDAGPAGFTNADYRSWISQADGASTDGPLGFWLSDQGQMQSGSYSMVKYAHSLGKQAVVMLAPYAAGISAYNPDTMFLSTAIDCVRRHEDNDAEPDIYDVFEYATTIDATPEQVNGMPVQNSSTAVAYYLIKHIHGDPGTLSLSIQQAGSAVKKQYSQHLKTIKISGGAETGKIYHYLLKIHDSSTWLDYAAVLRAKQIRTTGWTIQYKLGSADITSSVLGAGYQFYQANRINPNSLTTVDLYLRRTSSNGSSFLYLVNSIRPHHGQEVMDVVTVN